MRTFSLLFCLLILNSYLAYSQKDYAISIKGDTLKGKIKMYSYENLDRVQINTSKKKTTYTALQVKSFVKDDASYQTVKKGNAYRFMKVIKQGYLSLHAFNTDRGTWDGRYLSKKDGSGLEVPNLAFKRVVGEFLSDNKEVHDKFEKDDFSRRDLEKIVDLYNQSVQAKNEAFAKQNAPVSAITTEKLVAISSFSQKVEIVDFLTRKDVKDLLADIKAKVSKNETVPNYLFDSLKTYLADTPDLSKEAEELIVLLKK